METILIIYLATVVISLVLLTIWESISYLFDKEMYYKCVNLCFVPGLNVILSLMALHCITINIIRHAKRRK